MATPLSAIGKYAGVLMAVLCVLLMFAFVIGDPLMTYAGGGGGGGGASAREKEVAVEWNGGSMTNRQLEQAVIYRNILAEFQQRVYETGARAAMAGGIDIQFTPPSVRPIDLPRTREQGVEQNVVRTKIFAQRAREAGMVVSDEMIVDYLKALGYERVSNDQMRTILSRMGASSGRKATIGFVFDLLREAMLANNYLASHSYAFRTILPEERWEDWRKLNDRVVVEAAPLAAEDFLDEVPEPTDAELEEFYEEYREREPSPDFLGEYGNVELPSPLPAFATPPRVRLATFRADLEALTDTLLDEITDEQIAAFYEENKESFVSADRGLFGDDSLFGEAGELEQGDDAEQESADAGNDSSESTEEAGDAEIEPGTPSEDAEASTTDSEPSTSAEAVEESTPEASAEPTTESVDPSAEAEAAESVEEALTEEELVEEEEEDEQAEDAAAEQEEVVYQPLEEVSDEIRRRLASEQAAKQIEEQIARVQLELDDAYVEYFDAKLDAEESENEAEPTLPTLFTELDQIAAKEGFELIEQDEVVQFDFREAELGKSLLRDPGSGQTAPLWYVAFRGEDLDVYQPIVSFGADGSRYLTIVTKRDDAESPELEEIRDEVVAAWKKSQAADLALERARELAEAIGPAGQSIADYLTDHPDAGVASDSVEETDAFSLFTIGPIAPSARNVPVRLSQPEPLIAPGPELLESIFDLGVGEVGAELNHDRTIAYVLRVAKQIGSPEELHREFLRDGDRWLGAESLFRARTTNKIGALLNNLMEESGLVWVREPDQIR